MWRRLVVTVAAAVVAGAAAPAARADDVRPFGVLQCTVEGDVRVCRGGPERRVPTWDGVPLDVNVLLPAGHVDRLALAVVLGGYPGGKPGPDGAFILPSQRELAARGFAVLAVGPRGTYHSCGYRFSALTPECLDGHARIADSRYEARDVQHLAGRLVDEGLVDGRRVGVVGESYGGGTAAQLAVLRDRVRLADGRLTPWRSPGGAPMRIAAVAALTTWDDLGHALAPNGRLGVRAAADPATGRRPPGVMLASFFTAFVGLSVTGIPGSSEPVPFRIAPPGRDPGADLYGWYAALARGEPYDDGSAAAALEELHANHSAAGLPLDRRPAPTLFANGVADELFGADHALRFADRVARVPGSHTSVLLGDWGHGRSANHRDDLRVLRARTVGWLERWLRDGDEDAAPDGVEALAARCGEPGPALRAETLDALATGAIRFAWASERTVVSIPGDRHGRSVDPVAFGDRCATVPLGTQPGSAKHLTPPIRTARVLLGAPVVTARLAIDGAHPQLAARLWDIDPRTNTQRLITRTLLRPAAGETRFELRPTSWRLAAGHALGLELLGADAPYGRPSNGAFAITVSDVGLSVPTAG